ncbi:hypothetical protein [Aquibium sp. ELW1220]|uniref:hypothetical protein n=1 Tax=Aquibium sp. ELW1220 TaxID=2976766 RepID=UPI0025B2168F|nr:hypothetical protein [Aquibium sp. ELW1220]MDN2584300.1 hypothetical protein [Aquibium sp. ELW1220]
MSKPALVLIHGRSQAGKDRAVLEETWISSLRKGLGGQAHLLDDVDIRFPFYGDVLESWVFPGDSVNNGTARGFASAEDPGYLEFQAEVATEVLARHGIDAQAQDELVGDAVRDAGPRSPEWVQGLFRLLDRLPGTTGLFISMVMRDVYLYLNHAGAQRAVDETVIPAFTGNCVVVAHSLGSVVAYRLLKDANASTSVPLFMTIGSPLGIGPIRRAMAPRKFPTVVGSWINAYDERDDVALYPLGSGRFSMDPPTPIMDIGKIDNTTDNHHGIVEYLNKEAIAREIAHALIGKAS